MQELRSSFGESSHMLGWHLFETPRVAWPGQGEHSYHYGQQAKQCHQWPDSGDRLINHAVSWNKIDKPAQFLFDLYKQKNSRTNESKAVLDPSNRESSTSFQT